MNTTEPEQELKERDIEDTPLAEITTEPAVLRSSEFVPLNRDDDKLIKEASKSKFLAGLSRTVGTVLAAIIGFILAANGFSLQRIVSVLTTFIFLLYMIRIWYIFCKAERIFRIHTLDAVPPNWMDMSIAFVNMKHYREPMQSISEFSAISGGFGKTALARVGTVAFCGASFIVFIKMQQKEFGFSKCLSRGLFCQVIGAFGMDTIGTFHLDPHSMLMKSCHYAGVLLSLLTFVGLWMQSVADNQRYALTAIVTVVGVIFLALFFLYYPYIYNPSDAELAKHEKVTSLSRIIILFESIGLGMAAISFILFWWFEG